MSTSTTFRMDRRSFLTSWKPPSKRSQRSARPLSSGLDPFVPDANNPWDEIRAGHLLRRTMMSPTWADIQALVTLGDPGKAVDLLLNSASTPTEPNAAEDKTYSLASDNGNQVAIQQSESTWESDAAALRAWWAGLQLNAKTSIQEKMVYFWSGHFTTQFTPAENTYVTAPLLFRQNKIFRDHCLGNFQDLVKYITLDGAMLVFLGGDQNTAGAPNENYARELMELFTCGLGQYTEADVQNAARILTGWRVAQFVDDPAPNGIFNTYFDPASHDTSAKVYLSTSFPAIDSTTNTQDLVKKNEVERMIDVLFQQTGTAIAQFICKKLYRFFVYSDPATGDATSTDASVIQAMADLFIQNNFEIQPIVNALLKSAHFFDNANIGCQIKTPADYVIGISRQLLPTFSIDGNMTNIGQQFFQPPNVSGWPGYHDWVTTNTYPVRGTEVTQAIAAMDDATATAFIQQFPNFTDATALSTAIGQLMLPRPLSTGRQTTFASKLTAGAPVYEWASIVANSPSTAARNLRDLLTYIVSLPDFELV
ncbi:MAG TPA: DUF1800 domain-containing protein [Candidatus Kapabacteria bacterium]|nr:DUF1800 domain-containing protein [Candidatus Kapabacteria bacterium]